MRTITANEARECGMTASQVRTVARTLQRLDTKGYLHEGKYIRSLTSDDNPSENRRNAYRLFKVAKELEISS